MIYLNHGATFILDDLVCISFSFLFAGIIITGGEGTETSIEMFPAADDNCMNIPPFPAPGNLSSFSSFYSPPKGESPTPSLLWKTVGNWLPAEVATALAARQLTPRHLASLGAVGKRNGLTTQH